MFKGMKNKKHREIVKQGYLRMRIDLVLKESLQSGFYLNLPNQKPIWIDFKYEKLARVCYNCGVLGHGSRIFTKQSALICAPSGKVVPLYGHWIRAELVKFPTLLGSRRSILRMQGRHLRK